MLNILAGPITITIEDMFSSPGGFILFLGIIGYFAFWIVLIFAGYKLFREFLKGDKHTKKQIVLVLFIIFFWFALLPAAGWFIDKINTDRYTREYYECIEKYPRPQAPRGNLTEDEKKAYEKTYTDSDWFKYCNPIRSKVKTYL